MLSLFKGLLVLGFCLLASCSPASPHPKCQSESPQEARKAQRALADFAINLYKNASVQEEHRDQNQVISPVSIALALALLENGADGQSRKEIQRQLVDHGASEEVLSVYRALEKNLQIDEEKTRLQIANAIYHDKKVQLKQSYQESTKQCLGAKVHQLDLQRDPEQSRKEINQWVSEKTSRKVPELLKRGSVDERSQIILVNAISFKSAWERSFNKQQTKRATFYRHGREEDRQQAQFMKTRGEYRHHSDEKLQAVELRYDQAELAMYVLLPKQRDGLKEVERELNGKKLQGILDQMSTKQVEIELPKWASRSSHDLKQLLKKVGVKSIFSREADLSRMTNEQVEISQAAHEAWIKVDENGSEAEAASSIAAENAMAVPDPIPFKADHPFMWAIVHSRTGAIVYIGKVNEIQQQSDE